MKVITATAARARFFSLIDQVAEEHEEVMITTKRSNAVLVSEDDWRSIQESLSLSSIPGFVESVNGASKTPDDEWVGHDEILAILKGEE
ncbi:MAG: type II toxin-antitoxin system Phd/YefM family antitoxin [Pyrinomonadaceae bacterium]|nr:type II toxin-antitoxin system Phd/YefM family antitoxin [Pyrinomonadaceae bacterium]